MDVSNEALVAAARWQERMRASLEQSLAATWGAVRVCAQPPQCDADADGVLLPLDVVATRELIDIGLCLRACADAETHLQALDERVHLLRIERCTRLVVRIASGDAYPYVDHEPYLRVTLSTRAREQAPSSK